jgi:hypothetical protein
MREGGRERERICKRYSTHEDDKIKKEDEGDYN